MAALQCLAIAILVACAMLDGALGTVQTNCTFPDIMNLEHDHSVDHTWRFLSPDPTYDKEHSTGQWSFHMHSVYISHGSGLEDYDSADGYDYNCIENVGENKVLVKRIEIDPDAKQNKFACLHFVPRSLAVVQLRISAYADTADASLCSDANLKNDDTTLVHFHSAMWYKILEEIPYMSCGLDGGYLIKQWYDQEGQEGCTADVKNSLRIEDECDIGSGLQVSGESDNCPSPLEGVDVYGDPLSCIAGWKDAKYTYSVATDQWNSFFVCLRTPLQKGTEFDMYIFLDGTCDSTDNIIHSKNYRKLQMKRFVVPDICSDALPRCPVLGKDDCIGSVPNLCRETCGICPQEKFWHENKLPKDIQGDWYMQTTSGPGNKVTISERSVKFPDEVSWRYFGESPCKRSRVGHQKKASEFMVVSSSVRGCLPRVATLMVNKFSGSVIGVQLSQSAASQLAMVNGSAAWEDDMEPMCALTQYSRDKGRLRDMYHTSAYGWQNLVQVAKYPPLSQCQIEEKQLFSVRLQSGPTCKGYLDLKTLGNSFDMVINDCGSDNSTVEFPGGLKEKVRYECMARFKGAQEWDTYIITRTPGETKNVVNETYVCWYLPQGKAGYLMPISSCDDMTDAAISLDERQPLARLQLVSPEQTNSVARIHYQLFTIGFLLTSIVLYM